MTGLEQRLQDALGAEHAAIFGYGALGPYLARALRPVAVEADQAHRDRRDALIAQLVELKAKPQPPEPAYTLPSRVNTAEDALKLAVVIEERTAAAWRATVPELADASRRAAVEALSDCAVRAARWRRALSPTGAATVAFPGT